MIVDDLVRSRSVPPADGLRVVLPVVGLDEMRVEDRRASAVQRDAPEAVPCRVAMDVDAVEDQVVGHYVERALLVPRRPELHQRPSRLHVRRGRDLQPDQSVVTGAERRADCPFAGWVDDLGHGPSMPGLHSRSLGRDAGHVGGADGDPLVAITLGRQNEVAGVDRARLQHNLVARPGLVQRRLQIGPARDVDCLADDRGHREVGLEKLPGRLGRARQLRAGRYRPSHQDRPDRDSQHRPRPAVQPARQPGLSSGRRLMGRVPKRWIATPGPNAAYQSNADGSAGGPFSPASAPRAPAGPGRYSTNRMRPKRSTSLKARTTKGLQV